MGKIVLSKCKPVRKKQIADKLAANFGNVRKTARELSISERNMHRLKNNEDINALVEEQQRKLYDSLPKATENITTLISDYRKNTMSKEENEHAFRASLELMKGAGMLPSNSQSIFIQQITNNVQNNIMPPVIGALIENMKEEILSMDGTQVAR